MPMSLNTQDDVKGGQKVLYTRFFCKFACFEIKGIKYMALCSLMVCGTPFASSQTKWPQYFPRVVSLSLPGTWKVTIQSSSTEKERKYS